MGAVRDEELPGFRFSPPCYEGKSLLTGARGRRGATCRDGVRPLTCLPAAFFCDAVFAPSVAASGWRPPGCSFAVLRHVMLLKVSPVRSSAPDLLHSGLANGFRRVSEPRQVKPDFISLFIYSFFMRIEIIHQWKSQAKAAELPISW